MEATKVVSLYTMEMIIRIHLIHFGSLGQLFKASVA